MTNGGSNNNGKAPKRISFGQLAVRKGYASQRQVTEALDVQRSLAEQTGKHKLIGLVMLEMGVLGTTELIDVLKELTGHPGAVTGIMRKPPAKAKSSKS